MKIPRKSRLAILLIMLALPLLAAGCSGEGTANDAHFNMASLEDMPADVRDAPVSVQQAYQFAFANPAVLQQLPCYCGCGAMGHTSNYACYVAGVDQNGAVIYDPHALGCSICVDITQDAMRLLKQDKTVAEIRAYVDQTYAKYGPLQYAVKVAPGGRRILIAMIQSSIAKKAKIFKPWQWLLWLALSGLVLFAPVPAGAVAPQEQIFHINASAYQYSPATIHVNTGDRVTLELVSTDVVHGIYIDGYELSQIADPGQTARLTFTASQAGTFRLRCSVSCGPLHPFMTGKLVVGDNTLIWRVTGMALLALAGVFSLTPIRNGSHPLPPR